MKDRDRIRGCLIGGAAGDALGYPVEFLQDHEIFEEYGERGITSYRTEDGKALVSDDTQMTLFTANGLLCGEARRAGEVFPEPYLSCIADCYRDWLKTQTAEEFGWEAPRTAWLNHVPALNHSRDPGRTCISFLMHDNLGSVREPKNDRKGCGGVMRVAPIGLFFEGNGPAGDRIDLLGAEAAALTHGHELGYIPAAMLVHTVRLLSQGEAASVKEAVTDSLGAARRIFGETEGVDVIGALLEKALRLAAEKEADDLEAIRELGEGWTAEETLAIAVYCAARWEHDFERALIAAVNHSGDSDSTGAVTGNILGALLGMRGIPEKFLKEPELKEIILETADDLYEGRPQPGSGREESWKQKYILHTRPGRR